MPVTFLKTFGASPLKRAGLAAACCLAASTCLTTTSFADENGVGFWLPGQFGSLAALPGQPGWSFATIYYHPSLSGSGSAYASREVGINNLSRTANLSLDVSGKGHVDLQLLNATYTFQQPILGGQLAIGMAVPGGYNTSIAINGTLTTPSGTSQGRISDSRSGFGDLYPMATLKWRQDVHNFMTYLTGDIPTGAYNPARLANFGIGHGAIDGGAGYTYADLTTGREFSVVTGLTYNMANPDTNYRNGIDWHADWGASQFISKQVHIGAVGYLYQQLTADKGAAAVLGDMKSRVFAVGPQVGYIFTAGDLHGYLNAKVYREFGSKNRPEGWNGWLTLAISFANPGAGRGH